MLLIITLAAGLALGGTYALTQEPIEQQALLAADNARKAALPDADSFEELTLNEGAAVDWAYAGLKEGNTVGYVAQKTVNGFGGKVEVITGVDTSGAPDRFTIGGISVGGSGFSETAGLGARSKEPAFTGQFAGKAYPVSYIKAGGTPTESTVDALTSATITTTAVVNGVNDIVKYIKADVMGIAGVEMPPKPADGVFTASEKGFRGPVAVEAAFDGAGKVTYLKVGDDAFAEDIGVGVIEPDFMIQFIGKQMPLESGDFDAIAGATISSNAVMKALNTAYAVAGGAEIVAPETPAMPEKPAEGVYSASANGFRGPVYVEAAFEDGKITYISVGDGDFAEDIGAGVKEPEFMAQFIGKEAPLEAANIDVISGATISSTAVVNALNEAFDASRGIVKEAVEVTLPEAPAEGACTASAQGFAGPVAVTASFDADGRITSIAIGDDSFSETAGLGARALEPEFQAQFIGKQAPMTLADIDALSGATITSTAVVDALNAAYESSKAPAAAEMAAGTYTEEVIAGNTAAKVTVTIENEIITALTYTDSAKEAAIKEKFLNAELPVSVDEADIAAFSVAVALNKAYSQFKAEFPNASASTAAPAAEEAKPAAPAFKDVRHSVTLSSLKYDMQVKASFVQNTLAGLVVMDRPAGSDQAYEVSELDAEMKDRFLAATMPLAVEDQETSEAALIASAINAAYYAQGGAVKVKPAPEAAENIGIIGGADGPTVLFLPQPVDPNGTFASEVICFFTGINVEARFENGKVAELNVSDKQIGAGTDYAPSAQEEAMRALFVGAALPLNNTQNTPYASAVAIAINQAFGQSGQEPAAAAAQIAGDGYPFYGSSVMFFTQYNVLAAFSGNTLDNVIIYTSPAGVPIARMADEDVSILNDAQLIQALSGKELPLDLTEFNQSIGGVPAYAVTAIAIAVNQAYANPAPGQQ